MTFDTGIIRIKENVNPARENLGLEKEGRSKFPDCYDLVQPAQGRDGRWITGLDEDARAIRMIQDPIGREAEKKRVRELRLELEQLTGFDLSGKSTFWDDFYVKLDTKSPLDMTVPLDAIKYYVLIANKEVVPSLKDTTNMDYHSVKYVVSKKHEDVADKVNRKKKIMEAGRAVLELMETPDQAILVGRFLGLPVSNTTPHENILDLFQNFIDQDEKLGSIDKLNETLKRSNEQLSIKLIFDDAIKFNVIRLRDGYYQRGNITYGKSIADSIVFLSDVKNQGELLSIQDEVDTKKKFG